MRLRIHRVSENVSYITIWRLESNSLPTRQGVRFAAATKAAAANKTWEKVVQLTKLDFSKLGIASWNPTFAIHRLTNTWNAISLVFTVNLIRNEPICIKLK